MKSTRKHASGPVYALVSAALLYGAASIATAQTTTTSTSSSTSGFGTVPSASEPVPSSSTGLPGSDLGGFSFNPPPCDFSDNFYTENGISVKQLDTTGAQRFGLFRQFGPPARTSTQANWVVDGNCTVDQPNTRDNTRILATTGGYIDDGTKSPTDFISIIAFMLNQKFFTGVANARQIQMVDIVSNFEAYAAPKQRLSDGTFALNPCGTMASPLAPAKPCFDVTSVATPRLRQDWRFASNRNAIDGSDNNDPLGKVTGSVSNSPFGYFCDDLVGIWIITYFWYTVDPANPGPVCGPVLANLAQANGLSLDGTPIIKTADELNNQLEANGCGAEGQEDVGGKDGGAVWLVCPSLPDPRNGAITADAFLDSVRKADGSALDPGFNREFAALQLFGKFFEELSPSQQTQALAAAATN
jgi:hypothetical protein